MKHHTRSSRGGGVASLCAALLAAIAVFLPKLHNETLPNVAENTLIRDGIGGVLVLACATGLVFAAYRQFSGGSSAWLVAALGLAILGITIYEGTGSRAVMAEGYAAPITGDAGLGLILAGLAGLLAITTGLVLAYRSYVES
jgi:hypothetical protein